MWCEVYLGIPVDLYFELFENKNLNILVVSLSFSFRGLTSRIEKRTCVIVNLVGLINRNCFQESSKLGNFRSKL